MVQAQKEEIDQEGRKTAQIQTQEVRKNGTDTNIQAKSTSDLCQKAEWQEWTLRGDGGALERTPNDRDCRPHSRVSSRHGRGR